MPEIKLINVNKIYSKNNQAVFDFNLDIQDGEFVVLVGPSGCGKSTTLRMIAGLEDISSGELYIDKKYMNDVEPKDRNISMVFQSYALFPNMSVAKNIGYGISIRKYKTPLLDKDAKQKTGIDKISIKEKKNKIRDLKNEMKYASEDEKEGLNSQIQELEKQIDYLKTNEVPLFVYKKMSKEEVNKRVTEAAEILGLTPYLKSKPRALSGGQQQRVALGRAIVKNCRLFLMDEPLSNLDAKLRTEMRKEIVELHDRLHVTTIYVTHDQIEAMTMADKIVVMKKGVVQQVGTPEEIYSHPANKFVAGFIGSPTMNFIDGTFNGENFIVEGMSLKVTDEKKTILNNEIDKNITLGIRPEYVHIKKGEHKGRITLVEHLGNESTVHILCGKSNLVGYFASDEVLNVGDEVNFDIDMNYAIFFRKADETAIY